MAIAAQKPILEIDKPDFVVKVYPDLFKLDLKHGLRHRLEEIAEADPILRSSLGTLFQFVVPIDVELWEISTTEVDERGKLRIVMPFKRDVIVALEREESIELKRFLDPLIEKERARRQELRKERVQALKALEGRATLPIVIAVLVALFAILVVGALSLSIVGIARALGWVGIVAMAVIVIQGFAKAYYDRQFMTHIRNPPADPHALTEHFGNLAEMFYNSRVRGWRAVHIVLALIGVTVVAIHGGILLPLLGVYGKQALFFPPGLSGPPAFAVLVAVGVSGALLEARRKTRAFGSFKRSHFWLMTLAFTLAELHIINVGSTVGGAGRLIAVGLLIGTLGGVGVGVSYSLIRDRRLHR